MKVEKDPSLIYQKQDCGTKTKKEFVKPDLSTLRIEADDVVAYENGQDALLKVTPGKSADPSSSRTLLRAVLKNGECNISSSKVPKKNFIRDIFTTLVDSQWRWTLTILSLGFFGSWLIFGVLWWLVALLHGDLNENHLPMNQVAANWTPCVLEVYGFTSCFLFSVETQHTTGYGQRTPTEACPEAVILMCIQNIAGLIIEAFLVGIFFAKMTRPKLRTQTLKFSKYAVVHKRDETLCLMFRVGDMRTKSRIIEAKIKAQLIRSRKTKEGDVLGNFITKLVISADDCEGDLFFIWPMTIVHRIDKRSPFYQLSGNDLRHEAFEIVVTLEGTIESTDQKTQARSSYLPGEVLWGHRFEPILLPDVGKQGYIINYSNFDATVAIETTLCSAAELVEAQKEQKSIKAK